MAKIIYGEPGLIPLDPDEQPAKPLPVIQVQLVHYEETAHHKEWTFQLSNGELKIVRLLFKPRTNKERSANKAANDFFESIAGFKSVEHSQRQRHKERRETHQMGKQLKAAAARNDSRRTS